MPKPRTADEMLRTQIGKTVKRLRIERGLTQSALGDRASKDQTTISKIEQGDYRALTTGILIDLAYGLECTPGEILDWPFGIMHVAAHDSGRPQPEAVAS